MALFQRIAGRYAREEAGLDLPFGLSGFLFGHVGHASIIAPHCDLIDEVDDLLTLTGLRLIHEMNVQGA